MNINSIIKPETREEFRNNKYRNALKNVKGKQVEFTILSGGKLGRKILRNLAKQEIKKSKGQLQSDLGKMKSRQERKAMAKALGVKFTPRYNGPVYKYVPGKDEEGNPIKVLTEVK